LRALLANLAKRGVNEVLLEAGQGLNGGFLQANLIDEFIFYYAPKLMGADAQAMFAIPELTQMQQVTDLQILDVRHIGSDIRLRAMPIPPK
jgi:diaminohydroxyphosphoribosylaminopyrimidine deaminase/5-amino-6-(5-phosphoribosylamino)uracil reductase